MRLEGEKIAILVEDGYDDFEFWYPKIRMEEEGAEVVVIGPQKKEYKSKHGIVAKPDISSQ
jgi:protease I